MFHSFPIKKVLLGCLSLTAALAGLFFIFLFYAKQPAIPEKQRPAADVLVFPSSVTPPPAPASKPVLVASYNIGYASGEKNNQGSILQRAEVQENLQSLAHTLQTLKPDILLLQEVDLDSSRTFRIDQLKYLGKALDLPYAAYTLTWNKNYVAWPYWPVKKHFGRLVSGQAVLSRFPILEQKVHTFEKPPGNPWWYNWYYLDRVVQTIKLKVGRETWSLFHVHLEAFDLGQKEIQLKLLQNMIRQDPNPKKIAGGDFNLAWQGIGMDAGELSKNRRLLESFMEHAGLKMAGQETRFYSFPSWNPDMRIDHLFFSQAFFITDTGVVTQVTASDHLAVWARIMETK